MALDIHKYENGKHGELLFQIADQLYVIFEPAFDLFRRRTGLFIDPYGDIKFCSGLGALIHAFMESPEPIHAGRKHHYRTFLALLKQWEANGIEIIFLGD